jgi:prepilin-type N-terminal cleavage/methylation domain-containing protein
LTTAARARFIRGFRGFTLAEVLTAVTIIGLLAVVMLPIVLGRLASARADAIVTEMQSLQDALQLFNRDVGRYPQRLDYLSVLPTPAASVFDACGTAISAQNQAKFRGPYINREIVMINPGGGITKYPLATGDSVESVLTRTTITNPVTGGTQQVLQILVYGPEQDITQMIDSTVDGKVDGGNGIVQYAAIQPNENTIKWTIPIKNGAC